MGNFSFYNYERHEANPTTVRCLGVLSLIASFFFLLAARYYFLQERAFVGSARRAQATVVQLLGDGGSNQHSNERLRWPVFVFYTSNGESHRVESSVFSALPAYKLGQTIDVLYLPEYPEKAKIESFLEIWGLAVLSGGVGILGVLYALGAFTGFFRYYYTKSGWSVDWD